MMIIVLNKYANAGNAYLKWNKIKPFIDENFPSYHIIDEDSSQKAMSSLEEKLAQKQYDTVVAAGGDGTVNEVINFLMDTNEDSWRYSVAFGAIGLGSSNDFHKPMANNRMIKAIPFILPGHGLGAKWDLGRMEYLTDENKFNVRYFAINSGLGLTANGNAFFNRNCKFMKILKAIHIELANLWTIVNILYHMKAKYMEFTIEGRKLTRKVVNVNILKKVHVSGGMRYDTPVKVDDGLLDIVFFNDMNRVSVIKIITNLYRGRFLGAKATEYYSCNKLEVHTVDAVAVECDGEVIMTSNILYSVVEKSLPLC